MNRDNYYRGDRLRNDYRSDSAFGRREFSAGKGQGSASDWTPTRGSYGSGVYHTGSSDRNQGRHQEDYNTGNYGRSSGNYGGGYNPRGYDRYNEDNDRNFFERAGDKIRETWNDWTDGDDDRNYRGNNYSSRGNYGGGYDTRRHDNDRNFFERAGDKIRETWNDWTEDDDRDYRRGYGNTRGYSSNSYNRRDDDRGFFDRMGDRARETWNDWTNNDDDRDYRSNSNYRSSGYNQGSYGPASGMQGRSSGSYNMMDRDNLRHQDRGGYSSQDYRSDNRRGRSSYDHNNW